MKWMEEELELLADASRERSLRITSSVFRSPGYKMRGERTLLNLSSNDYLGLAQHPAILEAMRETLLTEGASPGASRHVTGNRLPYGCLEEELADWQNCEAALVFANGYMANSGVFNAGFALVVDMQVLGRNGNIESVFTSVREWETARQAGAFTSEQRERLKDLKSDWHLEASGEGKWNLYPVHISKPLVCNPAELQPGQPGGADWTHFNRYADQPLKFTLRVIPSYCNEDASIKRPTFYTNGVYMTFDTEVFVNQYLVCEGDRIGKIYDQNWNLLKTVHAFADAPIVRTGGQPLSFSCKFEGAPKPLVSVRVTTWGEGEEVVK
ncbi:aminotransferase class I/II-fold pyridoxal phosphate-dependent enzyme [Paenibacillus sp. MCAF9]|uniref:aminotransferase class I/II-fold pyridoxal phosphate-dependent enzyme n=1 Tax=Paenibacillus sp. MCAF9 TaxID=3233046 RepID=UPI003F9C9209